MKSFRRLLAVWIGGLIGGVVMADEMPVARDIGVPVKGVNWVRLHAGATAAGEASLLVTMGQNNGGLIVLDVDLETGHCSQFSVSDRKNSTFPTATFRSLQTGILYIGSAWDAHLHRFDPEHPERGVEDLGSLGEGSTFPTGINEAPDGTLWIGTAPESRLIKYDPATGDFTHFGRMHDDENYLYPLVGDDYTIAALVRVVRPHMVLVDPVTGDHREVGIEITDSTDKSQFIRFFKGVDRRLYVSSHTGDFMLRDLTLMPVKHLPDPMPGIHAAGEHMYQATFTMPGGWQAKLVNDRSGTPRDLLVTNVDPKISSRRLNMDWVGGGSNVHVIEEGPDGMLYGSSYLPNHLYRSSLDGTISEDLGQHSIARGQAYSATTVGDKVYLASYPQARLSVYDPSRPIRFGTEASDNPRDLGRFDDVGYRPNALISSADGKLWMGSGPDYGLIGGTLAWYDPETGESNSHRAIVPDMSPTSLLWLDDIEQVLVGLSIEVGTGAEVQRHDAGWALWDPKKDELAWWGDLGVEDMADVTSLAPAGDGLVYALIGRGDHLLTAGAPPIAPRLALIDPAKRELVSIAWLPEEFGAISWHGHHSLRVAPNGDVYGATAYTIFRITPGTTDVERIWQVDEPVPRLGVWMTSLSPNSIDIVGPIVGDQMFFSTGWRIRAITLPNTD
ncbi:MAG: hypothetical protein HOH58_02165 [Opitutaceae bacterium]|jgi:hypothetical protein|nr:hypothetical protein [Opitutaceae bacterium]